MDPQRLKQAYAKLRSLDERMTFKVRPRTGGGLSRTGIEQLEEKLRDLASYTIELKDVVRELMLAIGSKPKAPGGGGGSDST